MPRTTDHRIERALALLQQDMVTLAREELEQAPPMVPASEYDALCELFAALHVPDGDLDAMCDHLRAGGLDESAVEFAVRIARGERAADIFFNDRQENA